MQILSVALAVAVAASGFSTAVAQAGGAKKKSKDEPQFDQPEKKVPADVSDPNATHEQALERALPVMQTWPSEAGENAVRTLIARGPDLIPLLRARMKGGTVLERACAARGLCLLDDKDSFDEVKKLFADPRQHPRFVALLASLHDLDAERARLLAFDFLDSDQGPLRAAALRLLQNHATPDTIASLEQRLVATKSDVVRVDVFAALETLADRKLPAIALERYLGDATPGLAARVTRLLAWQEDAAVRDELVRLAKSHRERKGLHACLALALAEQRLGRALLPDELFDEFLPTLRTSDLLLRATSCVVCGMIGNRVDAHREETQLQVLPALADVVVNGRFFGDFELCFDASVKTLELLTGERKGGSVPAWREWVAAHPNGSIAVRCKLERFALDGDAPLAIVKLSRADATGDFQVEETLVGAAYRPTVSRGDRPGTMVLPDAEMRALLGGLEENGFFAADLPRTLEGTAAGRVRLTVETRGRDREVTVAVADARARKLVDVVRAAAAPQTWQVLLAPGEKYARDFSQEEAWFATHGDATERRSRLVDLALAQMASSDSTGARAAIAYLESLDSLGETVRATQVDAMAAQLARLPSGDVRARKLFELLVATKRSDAFDGVVAALASRGPVGGEWLADAVVAFGNAAKAATDPRASVRLAALAAAQRHTSQQPVLLPDAVVVELATHDADERVRDAALGALARSGSPLASTTLLAIATDAQNPAHIAALRRLGGLRNDAALAQLVAAARGADAAAASAALEGLSRRGDEPAAAALDAVVRERGPSDPFGRLALAALKTFPRPIALARLRRLAAEASPASAKEAQYGLADLGETECVPVLLADLEDTKLHRRAQTLLTYLLCKDVGTETWRFRSLFESQPGATHADWFLAALKESGATLPDGKDVRDRAMLPLLVSAIEDPRWFVRRSALEFLESTTDRARGSLSVDASRDEIEELARRWREATSTQADGK